MVLNIFARGNRTEPKQGVKLVRISGYLLLKVGFGSINCNVWKFVMNVANSLPVMYDQVLRKKRLSLFPLLEIT